MGRLDNDEEIIAPIISATPEYLQSPTISDVEPIKLEEKKDEILTEIREVSYNVGDVGESEEEDTEEVEDGRLLTGQNYQAPDDVDKFIDTSKDEIVDKSKLTHWDVIKAVAKQNNVEIRNPRSGCKHCYGRGYIGWDNKTGAPIPCSCIYPPKTFDQKLMESNIDKKNVPAHLNKKKLKQLKKLIKSEKKLINKQKREEEERLKKVEG
jgi:hypothetical protein